VSRRGEEAVVRRAWMKRAVKRVKTLILESVWMLLSFIVVTVILGSEIL
jgi:hypothetical protein